MAIKHALMPKNILLDIRLRINDPEKQPNVRKIKYKLVANAASFKESPTRSINNFGAVVFVPTSMPTWHIIARKQISTNGLPSKAKHSPKVEALPSIFSSSIGVTPSQRIAKIPTMR